MVYMSILESRIRVIATVNLSSLINDFHDI